MKLHRLILLAAGAALSAAASAQEAAPLVREERPVEVKVKKRDSTTDADAQAKPTPTPDPATVIVAVVNRHSLTRADLDRRMAVRTGGQGRNVVHADAPTASDELIKTMSAAARSEMKIVDLQDEFAVESAIRDEERAVVNAWIDQMTLADEARRQGFLVSDEEFRARLAQIENEFRLSSSEVKGALNAMGMSSTELEGYIYDAILVEKLLARFVELNYDDAHLHTIYDSNPGMYTTPQRYEIAHFTISLLGDESPKDRDQLKKDAENIRKRLKAGERPDTLFAEINKLEYGFFGATMWWHLGSPQLHPQVKAALAKMKEGDISDVIVASRREGKEIIPESYHVVKVLQIAPSTGETFETALPRLRESAQEAARLRTLELIREAKTHKRLVNLGGLPPEKLLRVSAESLDKPPIDLKL